MILITATHGIGDFNGTQIDKVDLLGRLQQTAEETFPGRKVQVRYLAYEQYLDNKPASKVVTLAAMAATAYYAGSPAVGKMLADYGDDVLEYYMSRLTRATISALLASELAGLIRLAETVEPVEEIIMFGHSLGSLAVLRLLNLLQMASTTSGQAAITSNVLLGEFQKATLQKDLLQITSQGKRTIKVALLGSPAFSRTLKGVKLATQKMALAESPISTIVDNQKGTPIVNLYSGSHFEDPLAGPAGEGFIDVNAGNVLHTDIEGHVRAMLADQTAAAFITS